MIVAVLVRSTAITIAIAHRNDDSQLRGTGSWTTGIGWTQLGRAGTERVDEIIDKTVNWTTVVVGHTIIIGAPCHTLARQLARSPS